MYFIGLGLSRPGRILYNLRKLNELPYHLTQSGRKDDLKKVELFYSELKN